jgi:hypothetical protein
MDVDFVFTARRHLHRLRDDLAAVKAELKFRRFWREWKYGFNPGQPRVPIGSPGAGQWANGGGGRVRIAASDRPRIARRTFGGTLESQSLEVFSDRDLCRSCSTVLPYVGLALGNPTVTFVGTTGLSRTMRNGAWID